MGSYLYYLLMYLKGMDKNALHLMKFEFVFHYLQNNLCKLHSEKEL